MNVANKQCKDCANYSDCSHKAKLLCAGTRVEDLLHNCADFVIKGQAVYNEAVTKLENSCWLIDKSFTPFVCTCPKCSMQYNVDGAFDWNFCPNCGFSMHNSSSMT